MTDSPRTNPVEPENELRDWWPMKLIGVGVNGVIENFCWQFLMLLTASIFSPLIFKWVSGPLILAGVVTIAIAVVGVVFGCFYKSGSQQIAKSVAFWGSLFAIALLASVVYFSATEFKGASMENHISRPLHSALSNATREPSYGTNPIRDATDQVATEVARSHDQQCTVAVEVYAATKSGKTLISLPCCSAHYRAPAASRKFDVGPGTTKNDWGLAGYCYLHQEVMFIPSIHDIPEDASYAYKNFDDFHDREYGRSLGFILVPVFEDSRLSSGLPVGVIALASSCPDYFSGDDTIFAELLAKALSLALTNYAKNNSTKPRYTTEAGLGVDDQNVPRWIEESSQESFSSREVFSR